MFSREANKKDTVSQIGVFLELALFLYWWAVLGSNQWLPPCEGGTLPLS